MTTDIRHTNNQVFATVHGKKASKAAEKFGVRINKSRYWFTSENWKAYQEAVK